MPFIKTTIGRIGVVEELVQNEEQSKLIVNIPTIISGVNVTSISSSVDDLQTTINTLVSGTFNASSLEDIDDVQYDEGFHVWVSTFKDYFRLNSGTSETVDNITVISASSGNNQWIRRGHSDLAWKNQTQWFIDSVNGSDENDGSTSGTPIKTWAELIRRVGFIWSITKTTRVELLNDLPSTDPILGQIYIQRGGDLLVNGYRTVQFSGSISGKTDMNGDTNTFTSITSSWTPSNEIGRLVHDQTNGRFAWVVKDTASGSAILSSWATLNETTPNFPGQGNTTVSASIVTYELCKVSGGMQLVTIGATGAGDNFTFQNIEFIDLGTQFEGVNSPFFQNCKFSDNVLRIGEGKTELINCYLDGGIINNANTCYMRMWSGVLADGISDTSRGNSFFEIRNNVLSQGTINITHDCTVRPATGLSFLDVSGDAIAVSYGGYLEVGGFSSNIGHIWGSGVTGAGLKFSAGGEGGYSSVSKFTISASQDIVFNTRNVSPAWDTNSGNYTNQRNMTFTNLTSSVANGGFGGSIHDPSTGCKFCRDL